MVFPALILTDDNTALYHIDKYQWFTTIFIPVHFWILSKSDIYWHYIVGIVPVDFHSQFLPKLSQSKKIFFNKNIHFYKAIHKVTSYALENLLLDIWKFQICYLQEIPLSKYSQFVQKLASTFDWICTYYNRDEIDTWVIAKCIKCFKLQGFMYQDLSNINKYNLTLVGLEPKGVGSAEINFYCCF